MNRETFAGLHMPQFRTDFIPFSPISKSSLRPPKADCDRRVCLDSIISYGFQGEEEGWLKGLAGFRVANES